MNRAELITGLVFGLSFSLFWGWTAPWIVASCALLWAAGGMGEKDWRRLGVPMLMTVFVSLKTESAWGLWCMLLWPVLSIGYGIPSKDPRDFGSTLGSYMYWLLDEREDLADFITRGILAILMGACMLPLAGVSWKMYVVSYGILIVSVPTVALIDNVIQRRKRD